MMITITKNISIPEHELFFTFSRSGKPGGQNVNKVNSRVSLQFDLRNSPSLTDEQRQRIMRKLKRRINKEGIIRVVSQQYRTQYANRTAAIERFVELMQKALHQPPPRKRVHLPRAVIQKRLKDKRHRSLLKRERCLKRTWDD